MLCPCHSKKLYRDCCAPYHQKKELPDPVSLMRSRFSAYAMGNVNYIIDTTHPNHLDSQEPLYLRKKRIASFCKNTKFKNLEILESKEEPPYAYVTFHATLAQGTDDISFTEKSQFAKVNKVWLYLSKID